ncbi:FG-GAP-like repeat-containing protein [Winogradskyella sp. A3E31]|uniref:FG-GAP-like repeat-containing protein n=1 Tax=Winogradskyella sp. A3E31 TaxID=3349637 RepID=UPI00398B42EB
MFIAFLFCSFSSISQIYFADEASNIGLTSHSGTLDLGPGVSFADYNQDGWDDITLTSGSNGALRFYRNSYGLFFEELLLSPAIDYQTRAATWVDYDNDGDLDLFVASDEANNRLFQKTPSGLVDVTSSAGFPTENLWTFGASWGDINNDGCLDVYISNRVTGKSITNYLYQNNCDGTFTDVTDSVGLTNVEALSFCSGFFDINNDGWLDIYVSNDRTDPNFMYKNNGDGTFTDISFSSGTGIVIDAMSVTVDDFNADGYLDLFITNTPDYISTMTKGSVLFKNNGDDTFTDISEHSGVNLNSFSWGSNFFDADNDGDLDLYLACSFDGSNGYQSYAFYEYIGSEVFSQPTGIGFNNNDKESYASAIGDINNDGKIDIVVINNVDEPPFVWNNQSTTSNNYLAVTLEGTVSNKNAAGAKIEISVNGDVQYRYLMLGEGYISQNSFKEIFGVGTASTIDYVKVTWPSGLVDVLNNISANSLIHIIEGQTLSASQVATSNFKVFPNPVNNSLKVESQHVIKSLVVYSVLGQEVMRKEVEGFNSELDFGSLNSGVYFVKVIGSENTSEVFKVVKQ